MRNVQRPRSHTSTSAAERSLPQRRRVWAAHPRLELISDDGVVAGYIHDISIRHGGGPAEARLRRPRGDQQ